MKGVDLSSQDKLSFIKEIQIEITNEAGLSRTQIFNIKNEKLKKIKEQLKKNGNLVRGETEVIV